MIKHTISISIGSCGKAPITERVKTFDDACRELGMTGNQIATFELNGALDEDAQAIADHTKLIIITKALNEGWQPNWNNSSEYKYYPYFDMQNGFSLNDVASDYGYSCVSSRLCFASEKIALYAVKQFGDLYKSYFTYNA